MERGTSWWHRRKKCSGHYSTPRLWKSNLTDVRSHTNTTVVTLFPHCSSCCHVHVTDMCVILFQSLLPLPHSIGPCVKRDGCILTLISSEFWPFQSDLKFTYCHCATVYKLRPSQSSPSHESPDPHGVSISVRLTADILHFLLICPVTWSGNSPRMRTNPSRQRTHFQRLS